jgi:hypothetical protein
MFFLDLLALLVLCIAFFLWQADSDSPNRRSFPYYCSFVLVIPFLLALDFMKDRRRRNEKKNRKL